MLCRYYCSINRIQSIHYYKRNNSEEHKFITIKLQNNDLYGVSDYLGLEEVHRYSVDQV